MIIRTRKNNMLCLLLLAVIAIVFGFNSAPAQATYSCYGSPAMVNLYAGQSLNIGTVTTCTDGNNLYVKYTTNGDWVLTETHLAVATSISSIPQTKKGSPMVGRFPYQATHASVNEYTYVIDLEQANYSEETQLYIAAHADVLLSDEQGNVVCEETAWGDGDGFSGESWATYFTCEVGPPILGPEGGTFEGDGGVVVIVPPGATDEYVTINIEVVEEDELTKDVPPNCIFMGAAKLDIEDVVLSDNADITIPCPSGVPENAEIYVAKVVEYAGTQMFMMVDTATVQGDTITSQDPAFPGILGSGTFVFLWGENVGWIGGQVTYAADGDHVPRAVVTLSGGYWLDIADNDGYYGLPAWAGNFVVVAFDYKTGEHGEKQGYMPSNGASVNVNIQIGEGSGPVQGTVNIQIGPVQDINGDFEIGDLTGWELSGAGSVVTSFGPISPYEGNYMAMISSGSGAVGDASSALERSFTVPAGTTALTIHYNFVSEEYPEYVGSQYNDVFNVTLHTPDGSREIAFEEVNSADFQPISGIPCGSGDCTWGQTGWITKSIDVSQWAGKNDTLTLTVHDVGDTIYDTVVLLDDIAFHFKIVFATDRDGNEEIYSMNTDGTGQVNLTNNPYASDGVTPADDGTPALFPDQQYVVFGSNRDGDWDIYKMNSDGSDQTNLTNNSADDGWPTWSPSGGKIMFLSERAGNGLRIYLMDPDGQNVKVVAEDYVVSHSAWSPDAQEIVFASSKDGDTEIYILNLETEEITKLTNNGNYDDYPAWSPDKNYIVFASDRKSHNHNELDLFIIDIANKDIKELITIEGDERYPGWVPDTDERIEGDERYPAWVPDGRLVLTVGKDYNNNNTREIYISRSSIEFETMNGLRDLRRLTTNTKLDNHPMPVTPRYIFQEMDGFGGSFTDSSAWLMYNVLKDDERQEVMKELFDPDEGIGLSYLRQPMGASDFALNYYTYDDMPNSETDFNLENFSIDYDESYIIPMLQQALEINPALKFMGTPWSAPAWMKTTRDLKSGMLKDEMYDIYADYFVKYVQAYAAHGIMIHAVTLQNEPQYEQPCDLPCMRMREDDQSKLAKLIGEKFQENGIDTKIIVWDHNWDNPNYPIYVMNESDAKPYIDGSAFHCYCDYCGPSAQSEVVAVHPEKDIYFTECSGTVGSDFDKDLIWDVSNLIIGATCNWAKTVLKWNIALDENSGPKRYSKCLDVESSEIDQDGGKVQIWEYHDGINQKWYFDDVGRIVNGGGKCLDVESSEIDQDGGKVQIWECHDGINQKWYFDDVGRLVNSGGKCLDVDEDNSNQDGGKVQIWECHDGTNQRWQFDEANRLVLLRGGGCPNCRGVITINQRTGGVTKNVEYYSLGHASKFVRPGAKRIESTDSSGEVKNVAFINPDQSIVAIVLNKDINERTINIQWNKQSFSYELLSRSVTTFTWPNNLNATVNVWTTTGDKKKLLEEQPQVSFAGM